MKTRNYTSKRTLVIVALAAVALTAAGTVLAQGPGRGPGDGNGPGFGPGHDLEFLAERLELTGDQVTAIEGIREAGREKNLALRKELMQLEHELKGELMKDAPSEKAALTLVEKIGALKTKMEANRLRNRLEVRKQLTPEQQDKMLMHQERSRGRRCDREDRGCRPEGPGARGHRHGECGGSGPGRGCGSKG